MFFRNYRGSQELFRNYLADFLISLEWTSIPDNMHILDFAALQ